MPLGPLVLRFGLKMSFKVVVRVSTGRLVRGHGCRTAAYHSPARMGFKLAYAACWVPVLN